MKRVLLVALCVTLLPGCLASVGVQGGSPGVSTTPPSVAPGSSMSSGGINARISDGPTAAALIGAAALGILFGGSDMRRVPDLDPNRTVNVQDCTQAIENPSANLRCR
ncbi:MAG: hypothetical protein JSS40_18400 [Proteobacteria bacterium]|nr:hypothetical protein [Pseudomonadota bacterium]